MDSRSENNRDKQLSPLNNRTGVKKADLFSTDRTGIFQLPLHTFPYIKNIVPLMKPTGQVIVKLLNTWGPPQRTND